MSDYSNYCIMFEPSGVMSVLYSSNSEHIKSGARSTVGK